MDRRKFLLKTAAAAVSVSTMPEVSWLHAAAQTRPDAPLSAAQVSADAAHDTVLVADTDRVTTPIDKRIYGQFLEHINHSVEDGLFAEQVRGAGFEGKDFGLYWKPVTERGKVELASDSYRVGSASVRLSASGGSAAIRQDRIFVDAGVAYDGSLRVKGEAGRVNLTVSLLDGTGKQLWSKPFAVTLSDWHEVQFAFTSPVRDANSMLQITATGRGVALIDFVSMMRTDARRNGMLRPDLLKALADLQPAFIRYPGGSFASTYKWTEGVGPYPQRGYHPNTFWGGYSDYFGFGTDEFLRMCKRINAEPLITLPAQGTSAEQVKYAMDWVHYCNDDASTEMGRKRAANGHEEPYGVRFFQIDNEPMNNGFTPESYAAIVNVYGKALRAVDPKLRIVACGQKRSSDMDWSETVIDLAGEYFDILGCHNYEYEPANYASGVRRIGNYLAKLRDYVRVSRHPDIELAVLEWSLQHTYDWRAGLHAAGSLMMYEELSPTLTMTCPALLMRNTTDDPSWTSAIYHDHVSWFPGGSYPVEKLFREHYAERLLASAIGSVRDVADRKVLLDKISTTIPQGWQDLTVDAIATASEDGKRIVVKAVNYQDRKASLLVRLKGSGVPANATIEIHSITAGLNAVASIENPDAYSVASRKLPLAKDLTVDLEPYTVAVLVLRSA